MPIGDLALTEASSSASSEFIISIALAAYVGVSLTIPFWVPIVKRHTGNCGVYWVRARAAAVRGKGLPKRHAERRDVVRRLQRRLQDLVDGRLVDP